MAESGTLTKTVQIANLAGDVVSVNINVAEAESGQPDGRILMTRHDGIELMGSSWERLLDLPAKKMRFLKLDALPDEPGSVEFLNRFDLPWRHLDYVITLPRDEGDYSRLPNLSSESSWWINDMLFRLGIEFIRQFADDPAFDVYIEKEATDRCAKYGIPALPVNIPAIHTPWLPGKRGSSFPSLSTRMVRAKKPVAVINYMGGHALSYCLKTALRDHSSYVPVEPQEEEDRSLFFGSNAYATAGLAGVQFEDENGVAHPWPKETPLKKPSKITFITHVWHQDGMETISVPGDFAATALRHEDGPDGYLAISTNDASDEAVEHIASALELVGAPSGRARKMGDEAVHGSESAFTFALRDKIRAIDALASEHGGLDNLTVQDGIAIATVAGVEHTIAVKEK